MSKCYTNKQAKRINMIRDAVAKVTCKRAAKVRLSNEDATSVEVSHGGDWVLTEAEQLRWDMCTVKV